MRIGVERHPAQLADEGFAGCIAPFEGRLDRPGLLAARNTVDLRQHDAAKLPAASFVAPEIHPVDIAVSKPQPPMMRMVVRLAGDILHRVAPRHDLAACRAQRVQIGLVGFRAYEKAGKRLAADRHRDELNAVLRDSYLRRQRRGQQDTPNNGLHGDKYNTPRRAVAKHPAIADNKCC